METVTFYCKKIYSNPICGLLLSLLSYWESIVTHKRHSLKSGPETRDLGPWDLRPGTLRPGTLGAGTLRLWDPATRDSDTQDPGNRSLGLGNCYSETQNPESRTLRIELVTQIPSILTRTIDWINFNCEANFDNKKLGHLSQKLRCSSRWTKTFTKIFWHLT